MYTGTSLALKTVLLLYRRRLEDLLYSFAESQSLDCLSLRSCGLPLASHLVAESEFAMVERLVDRKTESQEELLVRVATAREEVMHLKNFDYVVVNAKGRLDDAVRRVEAIIDAEKSRVHQRVSIACGTSSDTVSSLKIQFTRNVVWIYLSYL
ncbi:hypothetical protein F2Q69_00032392 [Brassica cretica]|uniref:Guanylate kinase-like domain-containing protein n=1 Tax=Brassica cretica TaxID=69181 RepID=A0A8S9SBQ3_BRACR|nr:hypothetical protein F2Q69_00032392 [Brassica cretica]